MPVDRGRAQQLPVRIGDAPSRPVLATGLTLFDPEERANVEQGSCADFRAIGKLVPCRFREKHPGRDLEASAIEGNHRDPAVLMARPAGYLQLMSMKRMERVVNFHSRTYGLMAAVGGTHTSMPS